MITAETTKVYVRVDLASRRVIAVSDMVLPSREGKPVFQVLSNQSRLDYYIVETNTSAQHGITVRAATTTERTTADAVKNDIQVKALAKAKYMKSVQIKNFYDETFIRRFYSRGFYTTLETLAASAYDGLDASMLTVVKPLGIKINQAYNEWRHGICQPVIDTMMASEGLGADLNDEYRSTLQDQLDTFLTERDFDISVFKR